MKLQRAFPLLFLLSALLLSASGSAGTRAAIPDFSFVHCSDVHVPPGVTRKTGPAGNQFGSAEVVAQIKTLTQPIEMKPYGVTVPPPSFGIATGDLTEFGSSETDGWWRDYLALWQNAPFPIYHISGNHDSTWASQRYQMRRMYGGAFYSFDKFGCHFIGWDSASVQDPRPSFGEEEINWLKEDLKRISRETPVFLYCHHPIDSGELASLYERDRLLDILRPYNLVLFLVGHGHQPQHRVVAGVDQVMGGSTFGGTPGYSVVSVTGGKLRVAYRTAWEPAPARPLLEKPLSTRSSYPAIQVLAPREGATVPAGPTHLRVRFDQSDQSDRSPPMQATWQADDEPARKGGLTRAGGSWEATVDTSGWEPGAHYIRFTFQGPGKEAYQRTVRLYTRTAEKRVAWRSWMKGSGKGTPALDDDLLLCSGQDGTLYAFDRVTGRTQWTFKTGGEILGRPLSFDGKIYFGSGDTRFYCVDRRKGRKVWSYEIGYPVYSGAVATEEPFQVLVAANNGRIYAFDPDDGRKLWECDAPDYSIESRPFVANGLAYYGSWDGYVYAIDVKDGSVRWKTQGAGSKASLPGVARYYAPADAAPVVAGGKVWIADRMYRLSILDAASGAMLSEDKDVSSVALAEDGRSVYLRGTDGNLRKVAAGGAPLWSAAAKTTFLPSAPVERGGVVYSMTGTGRVIAFSAADGKHLWEYQTTPRLYGFSDPCPAEAMVYVTGMDGSVTALRSR